MVVEGERAMPAVDLTLQKEIGSLYSAHHNWLYRWLRGKLGNTFDAADLAHDTFLRLMVSRRMSDLQEGASRAFLTHVAKGLLIDHWRRKAVETAFLETIQHLPEPEVPSPEVRLLILEALYRIDAMLHAMPAKTREIFLLAQLDGLRYQEIAQQCAVSLVTVKRHMRAAFISCLSLEIEVSV